MHDWPSQALQLTLGPHVTGQVSAGLQCASGQPATQDAVQPRCRRTPAEVAGTGHGAHMGRPAAWHQVLCSTLQVGHAFTAALVETSWLQ